MKKRIPCLFIGSAAFLLTGCGSVTLASSSASSSTPASGFFSSTSSSAGAVASSSTKTAFSYFDAFNVALLASLGQDNQAAVIAKPSLTNYTGVSASSGHYEADTSSGYRYTADHIDAAMNHCSTSDSSAFQAQALMSSVVVATDETGSGTLKPIDKSGEDIDLYLANNAVYYNFKGLLLWGYFGTLLRADLAAQGYDTLLQDWDFPQKGYYPFTGSDLSTYESLFPLTDTLQNFGAFVSPVLRDAYGINKDDFTFASSDSIDTITYSTLNPMDIYNVLKDIADGLSSLSSSSESSNPYASISETITKLEPLFEATTIHKFQLTFSFSKEEVTASSADIDLTWDKATVKAALLAAGEDDSTYPLAFALSGSATYVYGNDAAFTLPSFSGYTEVKKPDSLT